MELFFLSILFLELWLQSETQTQQHKSSLKFSIISLPAFQNSPVQILCSQVSIFLKIKDRREKSSYSFKASRNLMTLSLRKIVTHKKEICAGRVSVYFSGGCLFCIRHLLLLHERYLFDGPVSKFVRIVQKSHVSNVMLKILRSN